ncbi:MAG: Choline-phosphate cytidylyltransferase A [Paramarteilia canceri]
MSGSRESQNALEKCDYSIRFTVDEAKTKKVAREIRVYADGVFDLTHASHYDMLRQVKNAFSAAGNQVRVIVGISDDQSVHDHKGFYPVMSLEERCSAIKHCRYVDEVLPGCPWVIPNEFIEKNKIDFVAHDDLPYVSDGYGDIYADFKKRGMFLPTKRGPSSTTDYISRILSNIGGYRIRQIKKGASAKDLNMDEKEFLLLKGSVDTILSTLSTPDKFKRSILKRMNGFFDSGLFVSKKQSLIRPDCMAINNSPTKYHFSRKFLIFTQETINQENITANLGIEIEYFNSSFV